MCALNGFALVVKGVALAANGIACAGAGVAGALRVSRRTSRGIVKRGELKLDANFFNFMAASLTERQPRQLICLTQSASALLPSFFPKMAEGAHNNISEELRERFARARRLLLSGQAVKALALFKVS